MDASGSHLTGQADVSSSTGATVASVIRAAPAYRTRVTDAPGFIPARTTVDAMPPLPGGLSPLNSDAEENTGAMRAAEHDEPFLCTRLILLARRLEVTSETVSGMFFAVDSVFFGAAERSVALPRLTDVGGQFTSRLDRAVDLADAVFGRLGLSINDRSCAATSGRDTVA